MSYRAGYIDGYRDGMLGLPPLYPEALPIDYNVLSCGCYRTCNCYKYEPPKYEPLKLDPIIDYNQLPCGCYRTCTCFKYDLTPTTRWNNF